ncbi:MAG: hypothetical protein CL610_14525 [Anaerolineaceae bacterium]|nr:hypothetical protein [Anaerolineaceae bacterium]
MKKLLHINLATIQSQFLTGNRLTLPSQFRKIWAQVYRALRLISPQITAVACLIPTVKPQEKTS